MQRRGAIIAGSVSLVTLASGLMLTSRAPRTTPIPSAAATSTPQAPSPTSDRPGGNGGQGDTADGTYTLFLMSPQEYAGFKPILKPGLEDLNQNRDRRCKQTLARLTLISTQQSRGRIRVTSGVHTSLWYDLTGGPLSFVIPFPAPYELGKGELTVESDGAHAVLSLTPGFEVNFPSMTTVRIPVTWSVLPSCSS